LNRIAPWWISGGSDFGTLIVSVPQATANAATAADALDMRRTLTGRLMRGEIIRK
jgi:hypothetical protein